MNSYLISLDKLPVGSFGKIKKILAKGIIHRRMLDLGMVYDTVIESLRRSPSGDPTAYEIRGAVIALRSEEASQILVEMIP
ncbi:FeoA family protein [Garciella nitratireducens]|uniref:Ferrous iron transport protein A n=1 Tax=Garciella nitratireducens DSM 15102 TaxID=1121911 RepID=A0A1T4NW14_9FIRM|nr:FeoA family protein [Garciella nitratireducens]RBP46941.1 ferrous iron transport protein A [Garciella nitratireducens]SJZ83232.1 ferrous iron transport protein A [Garciella nitratireducens DSM 15102]